MAPQSRGRARVSTHSPRSLLLGLRRHLD
jgi:hypothetical protein